MNPRPAPPPVPQGLRRNEPYIAPTAFDPKHPHALAIYCSDGRFTQSVEDLCRHIGHERLDTLTMPGGPALLNLWSAMFSDLDSVSRAASFLIAGHSIRQVILLAHAGCGYYRRRYTAQTNEQIYARQVHDLRVAARALVQVHHEVEVALYYASPADARVRFDPVALRVEGESEAPIGKNPTL